MLKAFVYFYYRYKIRNEKRTNLKLDNKNEYRKDISRFWKNQKLRISKNWHFLYSSFNGIYSPEYIPEDLFYGTIEPIFNNFDLVQAYSDKNVLPSLFPEIKQPKTLLHNKNGYWFSSSNEAIDSNSIFEYIKYHRVVVKPSIDSGRGKNFYSIEISQNTFANFLSIVNCLRKDFIIQEFVVQSRDLSAFNESSVNTIRVMSLLIGNRVHIVSSHLRIGVEGHNNDHLGFVCGINSKGELGDFFRETKTGRKIDNPVAQSIGNTIEGIDKIHSSVMNAHMKIPYFRIVSWDFSLNTDNEPVLIEINLRWQGINNHQYVNGPLFGAYTQDVLREVKHNKTNSYHT